MTMRWVMIAAALAAAPLAAKPAPPTEQQRLAARAADVTIIRDRLGIAHVRGATDADAVFGMIYAQAEDDFNRIETNYLTNLGRLAEAEGEKALWSDVRQRLWIDHDALKQKYGTVPAWLRKLMDAWADGLNYYLATHPEVRPRVLTRFEPWMALSFSEGSIGGDISYVDEAALKALYDRGEARTAAIMPWGEPQGSNGIAIGPQPQRERQPAAADQPAHQLLLPRRRPDDQRRGPQRVWRGDLGPVLHLPGVQRERRLDAHLERPRQPRRVRRQLHEDGRRAARLPLRRRYPPGRGQAGHRQGPPARRHAGDADHRHLPHAARADRPQPTKASSSPLRSSTIRPRRSSRASAEPRPATSSNSWPPRRCAPIRRTTRLFADSSGNIAYLHPQFVPLRDHRFDYRGVVDGGDPRTAWRGLHTVDSLPNVVNPASGYVFNVNDAPWPAAGKGTTDPKRFPSYMDQWGWNPRTDHALAVLGGDGKFTPEGLRAAAYDTANPGFDRLLPVLFAAYDSLPRRRPAAAHGSRGRSPCSRAGTGAGASTASRSLWPSTGREVDVGQGARQGPADQRRGGRLSRA